MRLSRKVARLTGHESGNSSFDALSVLRGIPTHFSGIKAGVQIGPRWRTGAGYYFSNGAVEIQDRFSDRFPDDTLLERSKFYCGTLFGEWIALKRIRWEISLPFHLGFGSGTTAFYRQRTGQYLGENRDFIAFTEFSPIVSFRFCRWMGVGAGLGFRIIFNDNDELQDAYNAPITILRARFYISELYMVVKTAIKKKKEKKRNQHKSIQSQ